jgi:mannose-6-phosphate isomerase-like protein (cupin superfamily)
MGIIVKHATDVALEEAHGGAGSRRLYIDDRQTPSERVQGMTQGWLPPNGVFDWHDHINIEEVMFVIKGTGTVEDEQRSYTYETGTVAIFPEGVRHKITNTSNDVNEFVFIRIYTGEA